ncbi:hypothetical protein HNV11_13000 [Spirosoma taeanense]|uniref:Uncharacterized protein n=1 Tax=Spirosoma taeanense TaxID=2735870 RepID=A0A6M5Y765_9BACT|nr:hypothetical protein [Spirosoma taeanense]QJW90228.1 hypothetical protein HNV11_13000 [Spirosoma taeanense]
MFGLDPSNPAIAVAELFILLALAALVGWGLGRLMLSGQIKTLRSTIASKEAELEECRRSKVAGAAGRVTPDDAAADPLLPAFDQDETPDASEVPVPAGSLSGTTIPVEVPPLGAPIPEVPTVLPPMPVPVAATTPLADSSEAAVLNRIAARAHELNFDRIGRATAADADDLKDIVGIGPFLERKLHSLGIYTFRQIANFTKEDINKVNEIIEFFPGRIERDNWVDQAQGFYERKYRARN